MLSHKALAGDLASIRQLAKIEDPKKPDQPPAKEPHGLTLPQQLALEPEWQGDPDAFLEEDPDPDFDPEPDQPSPFAAQPRMHPQ